MGLSTIYCVSRPKKKKAQVIEPNGEPRYFYAPITIRDLLQQYPDQYCVRHISGSSLSMDDELEGGNTYLLLRLTTLFSNSQRDSNSRPSDGMNPSLRRAKSWQPSLHMIAENNTPLQPKKLDPQSLKKEDKNFVKPAAVKPKYRVNQNAWHMERSMCMAYMGPSGFIF